MTMELFAVHIADGILSWPWLLGGGLLAVVLIGIASRKFPDTEVPRTALLTAAFFVACLIRVRVEPTSVHLILNSLVGVILGYRGVVAVIVGLVLHACLLGHGGYTTLGVNCCIIAIPALFARPVYRYFRFSEAKTTFRWWNTWTALAYLLHFVSLSLCLLIYGLWNPWKQSGNRLSPSFRAGFITGFGCVVFTALLNSATLYFGGIESWGAVAVVVLVAHLPVALVEGIVVGFTTAFLERVKPELLR